MVRVTKLERADPKVAEALKRLRKQGRTIDEIHAKLKELDVDVARSTVGVWVAKEDEVLRTMRVTSSLGAALVGEFGSDIDDKAMRACLELVKAGIMQSLATAAAEGKPMSPQNLNQLSTALARNADARAKDSERQKRERKAIAEEMAKKVDQVEAEAEKEKLTPAEILARIRREVYGIIDQPAKA